MLSEDVKIITKELRENFKSVGLTNRQVGVNCKITKENGLIIETIYVMVLVLNDGVERYVESVFNDYKAKYESKIINFMFMRASIIPENFAKMWMK